MKNKNELKNKYFFVVVANLQSEITNKKALKINIFLLVANLQSEGASAVGDDEDGGVARVESRDRQLVQVVRVPWVSFIISTCAGCPYGLVHYLYVW